MLGSLCPEMQHTRQQPPACRRGGGGAPSGSFCAQCSGDTQNEEKPSTTPSSLPLLRVSDQRQTPVFGTNQGGRGGGRGGAGIWQSLTLLCKQVYPLPAVPEAPSLPPVEEPMLWPASEGCTSSGRSGTSKQQGILRGARRRGAAASKEPAEHGKGKQLGHVPRSGPVCVTQTKKYLSKAVAHTKEYCLFPLSRGCPCAQATPQAGLEKAKRVRAAEDGQKQGREGQRN